MLDPARHRRKVLLVLWREIDIGKEHKYVQIGHVVQGGFEIMFKLVSRQASVLRDVLRTIDETYGAESQSAAIKDRLYIPALIRSAFGMSWTNVREPLVERQHVSAHTFPLFAVRWPVTKALIDIISGSHVRPPNFPKLSKRKQHLVAGL
jgi:hypothetical protein